MPELPEVETIRRQLLSIVQDERIKAIHLHRAELLKNATGEAFRTGLVGRKIESIQRRSKYLIFYCEGLYPVFHLGMSGIFLNDKTRSRYPQHIHLAFYFDSGNALYYQDVRRFGKIWLYEDPPEFSGLGMEPLVEDLTLERFEAFLQTKNMNIKLFLMDQSRIAGIGNIYANEILFEAAVSPFRRTHSLSHGERNAIYKAVKAILEAAIERFGTTYNAYQTVDGETGKNQHFLKVYQRDQQACLRCQGQIQKANLGSRGTFFCPQCQH